VGCRREEDPEEEQRALLPAPWRWSNTRSPATDWEVFRLTTRRIERPEVGKRLSLSCGGPPGERPYPQERQKTRRTLSQGCRPAFGASQFARPQNVPSLGGSNSRGPFRLLRFSCHTRTTASLLGRRTQSSVDTGEHPAPSGVADGKPGGSLMG